MSDPNNDGLADLLDGLIDDPRWSLIVIERRIREWLAAHDAEVAANFAARVEAVLNDSEQYEYEGLSWNGVHQLRAVFGIPEPHGAWLNPSPAPHEGGRGA